MPSNNPLHLTGPTVDRNDSTPTLTSAAPDPNISMSKLSTDLRNDVTLESKKLKVDEVRVIRTHDFGFIPIPKRLQWKYDDSFEFTLFLNGIFGFASTFTVASLYYVQPILVSLALQYDVLYQSVVTLPTLLQAGYAIGLLLITPLGDLVRRRQLILILVSLGSILTILIPFVPLRGFQVICFLLGAATVTPQILLPLAGDLAKPDKRAFAISVVMSGLIGGILLARLLSGVIADRADISTIWYFSFSLQIMIILLVYFNIPDFPPKNAHLTYREILCSMANYAISEPVLVQSCLISGVSSAIFSGFWVTSTFLLSDVYGYNSLQIGLMALIGLLGVALAPLLGKLIDRLVSWVGVLLGITLMTIGQVLYTGTAGRSIVAFGIIVFIADISQQMTQVSNSTRVFAIGDGSGRARLSAVFIFSIFCGQLIGTEVGTIVYLRGGYQAVGYLALGFLAWMLLVLFSRGPHLPQNRWFGYEGGWKLRKANSLDDKLAASKLEDEEKNSEA